MYNGFFKITEHEQFATVECAPAFNDVFKGQPRALFDPDRKCWTIPLAHLDEFAEWLEERGHEVAVIRRHRNAHPHGLPQIPLPECAACASPYRRALLTSGRLHLGANPIDCVTCGEPLVLVQWDNIAHRYEPERPPIPTQREHP